MVSLHLEDQCFDEIWEIRKQKNNLSEISFSLPISYSAESFAPIFLEKGKQYLITDYNLNFNLKDLSLKTETYNYLSGEYDKAGTRLAELIPKPDDLWRKEGYSIAEGGYTYQIYNIKLNLITLIKERSLTENLSLEEYERRVKKAFDIVGSIKFSLTERKYGEDAEKSEHWSQSDQLIWFHMNEQGFQAKEKEPTVIHDFLLEATSDYLANPWMQHDYIDWILLDSLIYAELTNYRKSHLMGITYGAAEWQHYWHGGDPTKYALTEYLFPKAIFILRYIIPLVISFSLFHFGLDKPASIIGVIFVLYLFYRLLSWPKRRSKRKIKESGKDESDKILWRMEKAYTLCRFPIVSLGALKQIVYEGEEEGCIFNGAVYALIDTIALRNPVFLKPEFLEEKDYDFD